MNLNNINHPDRIEEAVNQKWIDEINLRIHDLYEESADTIRRREITATIRELESLKEEMIG